MTNTFDVLVLGEVLVELTSSEPLGDGVSLRLGFSGDALNAAAAAAAAGARTALVARVPDDDLGDRLLERVDALGVGTSLIRRAPGQHGVYLQHADPAGAREFVYARRGSVGSTLSAADLPLEVIARAGAVLASGIACAVSPEAFGAVRAAAEAARCFVYDPNWRPRLTDAATAAQHLAALAPHARLVTPAWPKEAHALLPASADGREPDPVAAAQAFLRLGARSVALTRGEEGVLLLSGGDAPAPASDSGGTPGSGSASGSGGGAGPDGGAGRDGAGGTGWALPACPVEEIVDATGAGDVLAGTTTARLALGDDVRTAIRLGMAAAALSLRGRGGTGYLPPLEDTRRLAGVTAG